MKIIVAMMALALISCVNVDKPKYKDGTVVMREGQRFLYLNGEMYRIREKVSYGLAKDIVEKVRKENE